MKFKKLLLILLSVVILTGCDTYELKQDQDGNMVLSKDTLISDIINYKEFEGFGKLLFPDNIDNTYTVGDLSYALKYHSNYKEDQTFEIIKYLRNEVNAGNKIFYNIYTPDEISSNSELKDVGLIYFRANKKNNFTICMAGGWDYVGSIHDSFPQALALSKAGYNSFALVYRNEQAKGERDLERAIKYIFEHNEELNVNTSNYSIWANGQASSMANNVSMKVANRPIALVLGYNNITEVTGNEVPTYSIVGTADQVINYKQMDDRNTRLKQKNIPAEIEMIVGLYHGFGLGTGTPAGGWINNALAFVQTYEK